MVGVRHKDSWFYKRILVLKTQGAAQALALPATRLEDIDELLPRVRQVPGAILDRCAEDLQDFRLEVPQHNGAQDRHQEIANCDHVRQGT